MFSHLQSSNGCREEPQTAQKSGEHEPVGHLFTEGPTSQGMVGVVRS